MGGVQFDLLGGVFLFLFSVWAFGRAFAQIGLPSILGPLFAGILLGPNFLDIVPYSSDGTCDTYVFPNEEATGGNVSYADAHADHRRQLAAGPSCTAMFTWTPRWSILEETGVAFHTMDIWSFAGTVGVTLLIMESGMHINFEKVKQIGGKALIVAIIGTAMPMVVGMLLVAGLFPGSIYPDGFAAGCALAPTSVGISIKLLSDAKMLNSMAGQTTLTAAFVDDVFS